MVPARTSPFDSSDVAPTQQPWDLLDGAAALGRNNSANGDYPGSPSRGQAKSAFSPPRFIDPVARRAAALEQIIRGLHATIALLDPPQRSSETRKAFGYLGCLRNAVLNLASDAPRWHPELAVALARIDAAHDSLARELGDFSGGRQPLIRSIKGAIRQLRHLGGYFAPCDDDDCKETESSF